MDREELAFDLRLRSKGAGSCNALGSKDVAGPYVSCRAGPQTVMVGNQAVTDTTPNFQHVLPLLVRRFHTERVTWPSWVAFKQHSHV